VLYTLKLKNLEGLRKTKAINFRFMVPYIVMITLNKNANQMYFALKILKILSTLFSSTCFGHHCVHHQELFSCTCSLWSRVVLGSLCPPVLLCCNCSYNIAGLEAEVFSADHGCKLPPHSYENQRLQRQFDGLLMMGILMPETC